MNEKELKQIEDELHTAFWNLMNANLKIEDWLDSELYRKVATNLMDLRRYYLHNSPNDGRLALHLNVMHVIWGITNNIMGQIVYIDDMEKRRRLYETWEVIYDYISNIVGDAQATIDNEEDD